MLRLLSANVNDPERERGVPQGLDLYPHPRQRDADGSYATVSAPELRLGLGGQSLWQRVGNTRARGHHPGQATCSCSYPAEVWVRPGLEAPWLSRSREGELGGRSPPEYQGAHTSSYILSMGSWGKKLCNSGLNERKATKCSLVASSICLLLGVQYMSQA